MVNSRLQSLTCAFNCQLALQMVNVSFADKRLKACGWIVDLAAWQFESLWLEAGIWSVRQHRAQKGRKPQLVQSHPCTCRKPSFHQSHLLYFVWFLRIKIANAFTHCTVYVQSVEYLNNHVLIEISLTMCAGLDIGLAWLGIVLRWKSWPGRSLLGEPS